MRIQHLGMIGTMLVALVVGVMGSAVDAHAAENFKIDTAHSTVIFSVHHLGVSNAFGRFNQMTGTLTFDRASVEHSSVKLTIDAASLDTANAKRDKHLRSPDFFNVKQFPSITFESNKVRALGTERFEVVGTLTLLGVSKPLTLQLNKVGEGKDPWGGYRIGFDGELKIKRSDFGMKYMLGGLGDEVRVILSVEAIRQ